MNSRKVIIASAAAISLAGLLIAALSSGALISSRTITSTGVLATASLGLYTDSSCAQNLAWIDWGTLSSGGSVTRTVYIKNIGSTQVTLTMSATNWNPVTANGPLIITWNKEGTILAVDQMTTATLTLTVSSAISGITSFSADIVISGVG